MPSRYILSTTPESIESKFAASLRGAAEATSSLLCETTKQPLDIYNNYNISPGQFAPVITNDKPHEIQLFKFGLTPFWAKSEMNLFNVPRWRAFVTRVGINSLNTLSLYLPLSPIKYQTLCK